MRIYSIDDFDSLATSQEYSEFIMRNCCGDRVICNGDQLLLAMEDGYLWSEFCASIGAPEEDLFV